MRQLKSEQASAQAGPARSYREKSFLILAD